MSPSNIQVLFFQHLKMQLPPHLSMADEVANLLEISNDSAYRKKIMKMNAIGLYRKFT